MTKPRGRPPQGEYSNRRAVFSSRLSVEVRRALEAASKASGRSLSQEVEHRLRGSFEADEKAKEKVVEAPEPDSEAGALARLLVMTIEQVERVTQRSWTEDPYTTKVAAFAVANVVRGFRPKGRSRPPRHLEGPAKPRRLGKSIAAGVLDILQEGASPAEGVSGQAGLGGQFESYRYVSHELGNLVERLG